MEEERERREKEEWKGGIREMMERRKEVGRGEKGEEIEGKEKREIKMEGWK